MLTVEELKEKDKIIGEKLIRYYPDYFERTFICHTDVRRIVYEKTNGRCAYCGKEFKKGWHDDFMVDHLYPYDKYQCNYPYFLFPCCGDCNTKKRAQTPDQWSETFKKIHGTDWFWYERAFGQINYVKVYEEFDDTGLGYIELPQLFRDKPWFDSNTICCGSFTDLFNFLSAFPKLTENFKTDIYTFELVRDRMKDVYMHAKTKLPMEIPEIIFNK